MNISKKNAWFPNVRNDEAVKLRLFCLPFAGGTVFTYREWQKHLPAEIDVCPVQLPGRANRIGEKSYTDISDLTARLLDEIVPLLETPFAFFGYSMGAILAYELTELLHRQGFNAAHLFVAACRAPHLPSRTPDVHNLPSEEFKKELLRLNGTPVEIIEHPELLEIMLPVVRADFQLIENYQYQEKEPLNCSITAFGGDKDEEILPGEISQWSEHTKMQFKERIFEGDHFFIHAHFREMLSVLKIDLENYLS